MRPETPSPVTMACHAIIFLCGAGGLGQMRRTCLMAMIGFLRAETRKFPTETELKARAKLLEAEPVNEAHISEWFHRNY